MGFNIFFYQKNFKTIGGYWSNRLEFLQNIEMLQKNATIQFFFKLKSIDILQIKWQNKQKTETETKIPCRLIQLHSIVFSIDFLFEIDLTNLAPFMHSEWFLFSNYINTRCMYGVSVFVFVFFYSSHKKQKLRFLIW